MGSGARGLVSVLATAGLLLWPGTAAWADPDGPSGRPPVVRQAVAASLTLIGPGSVTTGDDVLLTGVLTVDGMPLVGAAVTLTESGAVPVEVPVVTDAAGAFTVDMGRSVAGTRSFTATFAGDPVAGYPSAAGGPVVVSVLPAPGAISLSAPAQASPDVPVAVSGDVSFTTATGPVGVPGVLVEVQVSGDGGTAWTAAASTQSTPAGTYSAGISLAPGSWLVRAATPGSADVLAATSPVSTLLVSSRTPVVTLSGPSRSVRSQAPARLTVTVAGLGPGQADVTIEKRPRTPGLNRAAPQWAPVGTQTWSGDRLEFPITPWRANEYRAVLAGVTGSHAATSSLPVLVRTLPRFPRSVLPAAAPQPRVRAPLGLRPIGLGAHPRVGRIPRQVKRQLRYSWRPGCVPLSDLRYVTVNYRGFDGYRYRGELVVRADVARQVGRIFADLYRARFPIRRMVFPDRWGQNPRGPGADDYGSMRADNTSGFNCRYVVGAESSRTWSPHSSGRAVDVNTWENPYASRRGIYPNAWFMWHRRGPGVFRAGTRPTRAFTSRGWFWGGWWGSKDWQHFQT